MEQTWPELIPRDILFSAPLKYNPKISPDGKKIAYIAPVNNVLNLWIKTIGKEDDRPITALKKNGIRLITGFAKKGTGDYLWVTDRYIVYFQDRDSDENWQLYRLNIETMDIKNLTPCKPVKSRIVTYNRDFPCEIIISIKKENQAIYDLYHIDITSGKTTLLARNPGNVIYWIIDSKLQILGQVSETDDGGEELSVRENGNSTWKKLFNLDKDNLLQNHIIGSSKDNKYIYMIDSTNVDTSRVVKIEIATGIYDVIAQNPEYDIWDSEEFLYNPDTHEIQAVCFYKSRKEWIILDETIKEDFEAIKKIDSGDFSIVSRDDENKIWIIAFEKDNGSPAYYIFNRTLKKDSLLFYTQPFLNEYTLSIMKDISFTSRDGLTVNGYITCPHGKNKFPLVLYVHGGPWWRDKWEYNPTVQWFTNRGYACLQINYRGSTGYGKDFLNAGNREWGGKMQDDLVDGVRWAIKKGMAAPGKIAIYGSGYGGYAALMGAIFSPELFCCAISIGCPGELVNFIQSIPTSWKNQRKTFIERVGNPEKEKEFLISRSPFYHVDRLNVPVLITYGLKGRRLQSKESYQIVRAIQSKGIEVEYLVFHDEGYNIIKEKNSIKLHLIAEKFLARHMGGRYEDRTTRYKTICNDRHFDERELIDKILKEEDRDAFRLLIEHYRKPLLKHLLNMTGDVELSLELLQETYLNIWTYLYTYCFDRDFFSWIYRIATNVAIKYRKIENNVSSKKISLDEAALDDMILVDKNMENNTFIQSMINSLKEPYKTTMILRFIEDRDYRYIAGIMNVTPNQVKKYLFRAKKMLQKTFQKYYL